MAPLARLAGTSLAMPALSGSKSASSIAVVTARTRSSCNVASTVGSVDCSISLVTTMMLATFRGARVEPVNVGLLSGLLLAWPTQ
ncbi:hypothetical protein D9M68_875170 [compost metagenome]